MSKRKPSEDQFIDLDTEDKPIKLTYQNRVKYLDREDIIHLLEVQRDWQNRAKYEPRIDSVDHRGKRSLAGIGKILASFYVKNQGTAKQEDLDRLIEALLDFDGVRKRRIATDAGNKLKEMLKWNIDDKYKVVISDFIAKYPWVIVNRTGERGRPPKKKSKK